MDVAACVKCQLQKWDMGYFLTPNTSQGLSQRHCRVEPQPNPTALRSKEACCLLSASVLKAFTAHSERETVLNNRTRKSDLPSLYL